jgi:hypothetical protein
LYKSHIYNILRQSDRQGPSGCAKLGALLRVRSRPGEDVVRAITVDITGVLRVYVRFVPK